MKETESILGLMVMVQADASVYHDESELETCTHASTLAHIGQNQA